MKNRTKRASKLVAVVLTLALVLAAMPFSAFASSITFTDVPKSAWFHDDVYKAVDMGLVNGKSTTTPIYAPYDNLSYSEVVKLAACMHQKYTIGTITLTSSGSPWYQSYVDYARTAGIIKKDYNWTASATRAGYMEIFAAALPDSALQPINTVDDGTIPDVPMTHPQAAAIYKLYRAGILQGSDAIHSCNPSNFIMRCEVAAILTRMMDSRERLSFTMAGEYEELTITQQPQSITAKDGEHVELSVTVAGGKEPYTYEWLARIDGKWYILADTVDVTLNGNSVEIWVGDDWTSQSYYCCRITDADGNYVTSEVVTITLSYSDFVITQQPQSVTGNVGDWATFYVVVAGGKEPYTYDWQSYTQDQWDSIDGIANVIVSGNSVKIKIGGTIDWSVNEPIRCVITDANGSKLYSDSVRISSKLTIVNQPESKSDKIGTWVTTGINVNGGKNPYTYRLQVYADNSWQYVNNSSDIYMDGAYIEAKIGESSDYTMLYPFRVVVTDANGNQVVSNSFRFYNLLTIMTQPDTCTVNSGVWAQFRIRASGGTKSYTFKWQLYNSTYGWLDLVVPQDGIKVEVTDSGEVCTLYVKGASGRNGGLYRCVVTDASGSKEESNAVLLVVNG